MQNEYLDMINKFNANFFASAKRLGDLNLKTFEKLAAKQAEIMNDCLESTTKHYEVLTTSKDYKEAMAAQTELMKGCNDKMVGSLREAAELMASVREEYSGMVEEAVKQASESVEEATVMATKKKAA
jgi:colicin import membrane protein